MILKSIIARRFRGIKRGDPITFAPGLNIVKGSDNEAGKSSLRLAITKSLFQDPTSTSEDIHKLTRWGAEEPWEIELEFQTDSGGSYHMSKSLKDKTCKLARIDSPENPITNKGAIAAKITEFSGCPSEVFFESTACIAQDEMIRIIPPGATLAEKKNAFGALTQRLQATLSGTQKVDVASILSKLRIKTHNKPAKGTLYYLSNTEDEIRKLNTNKAEQETKVNELMKRRKELNQVKEDLDQINTDLPPKQELLENNKKLLTLDGDITRAKAHYKSFSRAKGFKQELEQVDKDLEQFARFKDAEATVNQITSTKSVLQNLEAQNALLQNEVKRLEGHKPALWVLIVGIAMLLGGIVGEITGLVVKNYFYIGICAMVAIGGVLLSLYYLQASRKPRSSVSIRVQDLEKQLQSQAQSLKLFLGSLGFSTYEEFEREFGTYQQKLGARRDAINRLNAILGDKEWDKFEEENSDLDIKISASQKELDKLFHLKKDPLELQKLETAVNGPEGLIQRKKILEGRKLGLDNFFAYTDADTDQLASIGETLERLEQDRKFWERKQKIFETTRQVLEEANKQTLSRAADVLEKELGNYISKITAGKYTQVRIVRVKDRDTDLSIQTVSPEKKDWVNVAELSRATQDQFYICARFALVNLITEGKKPPLLLDDPFVNFHQKRLERTIPLLQELAKENQILLFTCSDAYDNYGDVISVD